MTYEKNIIQVAEQSHGYTLTNKRITNRNIAECRRTLIVKVEVSTLFVKAKPSQLLISKKNQKKATIEVKRQESSISTRLLCITYHTEGPLLSPLPKVAER